MRDGEEIMVFDCKARAYKISKNLKFFTMLLLRAEKLKWETIIGVHKPNGGRTLPWKPK